jgi:hypothetical protein
VVITDSPGGCYVILHVGNPPSHDTANDHWPPVVQDGSTRFDLSADIWIERLGQLAPKIQKACEPPHYNYDPNKLPHNNLYAFVRRVPTDGGSKTQALEQLLGTVVLSRLIHPTSTGDRYLARVFDFGGEDSPIEAIERRGISPDVFPGCKGQDWLSVDDAKELRTLMKWLSRDKAMHRRVRRALWNHEYAMRSCYLDVQWIFAVSGLEAMVNVGDKDNKWQFRDRVRQLAQEFRVALTDPDLSRAWDLRSKIVHAESFLSNLQTILPSTQHRGLYEKLESVLRKTVYRCLMDESYGDCFRDAAAVKALLPLGPKP